MAVDTVSPQRKRIRSSTCATGDYAGAARQLQPVSSSSQHEIGRRRGVAAVPSPPPARRDVGMWHAQTSAAPAVVGQDALSGSLMGTLPDDLLDFVLLFALRGHRDLGTMAAVCRRWRCFSRQDSVWRRLCIRGWGHREDIVQVPLKKEPLMLWRTYYQGRLKTHIPELSYLRVQQNITVSIRAILVNWTLAVVDEFRTERETSAHHQCVAIFDQYCARAGRIVSTSELQIIGAASAVLAINSGKDREAIADADYVKAAFYTAGACTPDQVRAVAERVVDTVAPAAPLDPSSLDILPIHRCLNHDHDAACAAELAAACHPEALDMDADMVDDHGAATTPVPGQHPSSPSHPESPESLPSPTSSPPSLSALLPADLEIAPSSHHQPVDLPLETAPRLPVMHTAFATLDALLKALQKHDPSSSTYCLAHYIGELALQSEVTLKYPAGIVGASAFGLATFTLGWAEDKWLSLVRSTLPEVKSLDDLKPCLVDLHTLLRQAVRMLCRGETRLLPHVVVKYSKRPWQQVAKVFVGATPWPATCPHGVSRPSSPLARDDCITCKAN